MITAVEEAGKYLYRMYKAEKRTKSVREPELCRQKLLQYAESFEELARSLGDGEGKNAGMIGGAEKTEAAGRERMPGKAGMADEMETAGKVRLSERAETADMDRSEILEERRLLENRMLLKHNLYEMAQIMTNIADELIQCRPMEQRYRRLLKHALRTESIFADHFCYLTDKEDDTHAVCMTLYTDKKISRTAAEAADMLSILLGRPLRPTAASPALISGQPHSFVFAEETRYVAITGFCRAVKENEEISGDQYSVLESEKGRVTLLLSDGTGSGEQASEDSGKTLDLMEKFLEAGYDTEAAANMVNIAFYAGEKALSHPTLDICDLNLYSGDCMFLKVGGSTSFVKRGEKVEKIRQEALPLGIFGSIDAKSDMRKLQDGDYVIMMTDGVLDALPGEDCEEFMENAIGLLEDVNPGEIAEKILELAIRGSEGHIRDDMTVLVAGIWENSAV